MSSKRRGRERRGESDGVVEDLEDGARNEEGNVDETSDRILEDAYIVVEGLETAPYVEDIRLLILSALKMESPDEMATIADAWQDMKFSYIYFSNPTVLTPVEFLQCLYQETISLVREPQKLLSTNTSDKRVSNVSMNLLVLLYECQPHRNTAKEAKIRVDKSTWIELKSRPQTTHLLQQHAYVLVVSSYLVAGPAAAQKNLEIRSKRPLTRAHMSQTYGYALNLGTSPEAAVDRDRRKRARELVAKAEAVREVGSFDSLDQSFRKYRVSRAALRDRGLTLPGRIVPSFAVDARARFDEFTVSKKR
eukprot:CAMPEP_0184752124 /NCGR_PEP_ID=MMETSP0315-20130426/43414_1 /TAXON_ID=101924 /ORGANISM="Rhodosorus marinus, Strain UTEX LB 2760" /LENGTH=305 /DNA_ID=CAMNT_0027231441 /DNA_START=865 /DNA_END=1782 /DNA_ORIENTATION=-